MTAEILRRLLSAFPLPPDPADADTVLAAFAVALVERQRILDELVAPLTVTTAEQRALVLEIEARDGAWRHALAAARDAVGVQRTNTAKLRGYAGPR